MLSPREQGGGLAEASRLLQEGLRLLDDRRREIDAMLEDARERALVIKEEAEQRAQQITADAERQRAELEEQVAALRSEVAALREELANPAKAGWTAGSSQKGSKGGRQSSSDVPAVPIVAAGEATETAAEAGSANQATAQLEAAEAAEAAEVAEAAEAAGTPRWGRRSTMSAAQQAIRNTRSARPRWLPPWVPFLIVLLVLLGGAAVVATNVDGQAGSRAPSTEAPGAGPAPTANMDLSAASVTSGATALLAVASFTPTTVRQTPTSTTPPRTPTLAPQQSPTATFVRQTLTLPPSGARLSTPLVPPAEAGPEGPIVAAYTMYATYTVRPGDTLNKVATQFGVTGQTIMRSSGLADPNLLLPGQVLTIPRDSGWLYRVQPGDTLELIALRFGLSIDDLMAAGNRTSADVRPGDLVFIPDRGTSAVPKRQ